MPFEKGKSGNPGGRPKAAAGMRELAQKHGPEAVERLAAFAFDPDGDPHVAIAAIKILLERGYGKPAQPFDGDGEGGPIVVEITRFSEPKPER